MIRATRGCAATAGQILVLIAALGCGLAQAQQGEPAMMKRAADLREGPGESGRSLAALPAQEPVTRLGERQGPWIQVQTRSGVAAGSTCSTSARPVREPAPPRQQVAVH